MPFNYLEKETPTIKEITMSTRLLLAMFTLMSSLIMMTGTVRAEQNTTIYLAADSVLEHSAINIPDRDNTALTTEVPKKPKVISKSRLPYGKLWLKMRRYQSMRRT